MSATFLLRAFCPRCHDAELIPTTSAPNPCEEPEAQAECISCGSTYCVRATVTRCTSGHSTDVEAAIDRASLSAAYAGTGFNP